MKYLKLEEGFINPSNIPFRTEGEQILFVNTAYFNVSIFDRDFMPKRIEMYDGVTYDLMEKEPLKRGFYIFKTYSLPNDNLDLLEDLKENLLVKYKDIVFDGDGRYCKFLFIDYRQITEDLCIGDYIISRQGNSMSFSDDVFYMYDMTHPEEIRKEDLMLIELGKEVMDKNKEEISSLLSEVDELKETLAIQKQKSEETILGFEKAYNEAAKQSYLDHPAWVLLQTLSKFQKDVSVDDKLTSKNKQDINSTGINMDAEQIKLLTQQANLEAVNRKAEQTERAMRYNERVSQVDLIRKMLTL